MKLRYRGNTGFVLSKQHLNEASATGRFTDSSRMIKTATSVITTGNKTASVNEEKVFRLEINNYCISLQYLRQN